MRHAADTLPRLPRLTRASRASPAPPPTPQGVLRRLPLFVVAARAALCNHLLPHTDALLRSAITDAVESAGPNAISGWADLPPAEAEEGMARPRLRHRSPRNLSPRARTFNELSKDL